MVVTWFNPVSGNQSGHGPILQSGFGVSNCAFRLCHRRGWRTKSLRRQPCGHPLSGQDNSRRNRTMCCNMTALGHQANPPASPVALWGMDLRKRTKSPIESPWFDHAIILIASLGVGLPLTILLLPDSGRDTGRHSCVPYGRGCLRRHLCWSRSRNIHLLVTIPGILGVCWYWTRFVCLAPTWECQHTLRIPCSGDSLTLLMPRL